MSVWGCCSQHSKMGYQHSIFTLHISSVMPANDSHWYGGAGGCHEKEGKKKICSWAGREPEPCDGRCRGADAVSVSLPLKTDRATC